MSDAEALKSRMRNTPWRIYKHVTAQTPDGPVEFVVRRPPDGVVVRIFEQAIKDGWIDDEGKVKNPAGALRFRARIVAATLWLPNAVGPFLNEDDALDWPGLDEVAGACQEALTPPSANLEKLKGK